jgi:hypothetical protein
VNYNLTTEVLKDKGFINQRLQNDFDNCIKDVSKWIIKTRDKQIRNALIKLGWKPPKHICKQSKVCTCSAYMLEPRETRPVHGAGEYPLRCGTCGRFMSRGKIND